MGQRILELAFDPEILPVSLLGKRQGRDISQRLGARKPVKQQRLVEDNRPFAYLQPYRSREVAVPHRIFERAIDMPHQPRSRGIVTHKTREENARQEDTGVNSALIGILRQPLKQVERLPVMGDRFGPSIEGHCAIRGLERVMKRLLPVFGTDPMMREQCRIFPLDGQCVVLI